MKGRWGFRAGTGERPQDMRLYVAQRLDLVFLA